MASEHDRTIIRDLAKRAAEIGNDPVQEKKAEMWRKHNDLQSKRPLVLIYPEGAWREMLTDKEILCTDPTARELEWQLRARIYYWEKMRDDNVIEPVVASYAAISDTGWGVSEVRTNTSAANGACHFEPVIKTEADLDKLRIPELVVDREATEADYRLRRELVGDILTVERRAGANTSFQIMDTFAKWRGLDQVFYDMIDRPEWLHKAMDRMYQGMVSLHEGMMKTGLVTLNNRNHYAGSGGNGYTGQLPRKGFDGKNVRPQDLWAMATTQIFSEVSPDMHEEFALQYERRYLSRFGLNCYGCCEPLHKKMDIVKTIPNLRRISISPWADVKTSAEQLGGNYIFSWKPNPAIVAGETWDPDAVRKYTRDTLEITSRNGCVVEMVLKDTHTCRHDPRRMWEWVRIAREVAEEFAA